MMKYKIVGGLNIIYGITGVIWPLFMSLFVTPKLNMIYSELTTNSPPSSAMDSIGSIAIFLAGCVNLFFGYKLISGQKEKYFKFGIYALAATNIISSFFAGRILLSMFTPMYQFSAQLQ